MRLAALTLIGALGLAATAVPARAAPVVPTLDAHQASGIVQVWGGCGPGARPVPGHWSRMRGAGSRRTAPRTTGPMGAAGYYRGGGYGGGGYGGGYPYWQGHRGY